MPSTHAPIVYLFQNVPRDLYNYKVTDLQIFCGFCVKIIHITLLQRNVVYFNNAKCICTKASYRIKKSYSFGYLWEQPDPKSSRCSFSMISGWANAIKVWANAITMPDQHKYYKKRFLHPTKCLERLLKYSYLVLIILDINFQNNVCGFFCVHIGF